VAVVKAITAQSGTSGYSGVASTEVTAAGLTDSIETLAFTGDNSSYGYRMVSGTWFAQPGQIVVATPFLAATHTQVGDTIVLMPPLAISKADLRRLVEITADSIRAAHAAAYAEAAPAPMLRAA